MLITLSRHNNEIITQAAPPLIQNIFKVSPPIQNMCKVESRFKNLGSRPDFILCRKKSIKDK